MERRHIAPAAERAPRVPVAALWERTRPACCFRRRAENLVPQTFLHSINSRCQSNDGSGATPEPARETRALPFNPLRVAAFALLRRATPDPRSGASAVAKRHRKLASHKVAGIGHPKTFLVPEGRWKSPTFPRPFRTELYRAAYQGLRPWLISVAPPARKDRVQITIKTKIKIKNQRKNL